MKAFRPTSRRALVRGLAAALVGVALALSVGRLHEAACRRRLVRAGFPESIASLLAPLQARHSNWRFEPLVVDDLPWEMLVDAECAPGWNLVPSSPAYAHLLAPNAKAYDSGAWRQASREAIATFMDPRNFLNETDVFMFESLAFNRSAHTRETTERALKASFLANARCDGGPRTFGEVIYRAGRRLGVNSVFLAARLALEQGRGTPQGRGRIGASLVALASNRADRVGAAVAWGKAYARDSAAVRAIVERGAAAYDGVYNLFNIGASGSGLFEIRYNAWREATREETVNRYGGPWTSQEKAIRGGAKKIRERYLETSRHTRYFQKFSVVAAAGKFRFKQYMQNLLAPRSEARMTAAAYKAAGTLHAPHRFIIPVYKGLPPEPSGTGLEAGGRGGG